MTYTECELPSNKWSSFVKSDSVATLPNFAKYFCTSVLVCMFISALLSEHSKQDIKYSAIFLANFLNSSYKGIATVICGKDSFIS